MHTMGRTSKFQLTTFQLLMHSLLICAFVANYPSSQCASMRSRSRVKIAPRLYQINSNSNQNSKNQVKKKHTAATLLLASNTAAEETTLSERDAAIIAMETDKIVAAEKVEEEANNAPGKKKGSKRAPKKVKLSAREETGYNFSDESGTYDVPILDEPKW